MSELTLANLKRTAPVPMSPFSLVQERVSRDCHYPWRVIVCCALLNQTHGRQVRPMLDAFFARVPDPYCMAETAVYDLLVPLGLQNRRLVTLVRMTEDYLAGSWPGDCYGVGQYGRDAIDLFCLGRIDLKPTDTWLRPYQQWRKCDPTNNAPIAWDEPGYIRWVAFAQHCRRSVAQGRPLR